MISLPVHFSEGSTADSIVRGTTSKEIIQMAKDVGAKTVIVASCAPPIRSVLCVGPAFDSMVERTVRHSNVYGIDMPSRTELVAYKRDTEEIAHEIGADLVIFQTLPDLIASVQGLNPSIAAFDCSVFTGEYVTGGVDASYLDHLESLRADNVKNKLQDGSTGALEGKGGGAVVNGVNGVAHAAQEMPLGCSGPMNGADDTIGLFNYRR